MTDAERDLLLRTIKTSLDGRTQEMVRLQAQLISIYADVLKTCKFLLKELRNGDL